MKKINGIAFDLEGTVIDIEEAHHQAHLRVMRDAGIDVPLERALVLIPHFIGGPDAKVMEEIYCAGNKAVTLEEMTKRDHVYFLEFREQMEIQPRPGFLDVLDWFQETGKPVSIGSLTKREDALFLLNRSGLLSRIPLARIVLAEDVKQVKPAPDVFLETARRMKVDAEAQLVFEDSPRGVTAALAAGSHAIGMPVYNKPETVIPLVQAGVVRIFMDWREMNCQSLIANLEAVAPK